LEDLYDDEFLPVEKKIKKKKVYKNKLGRVIFLFFYVKKLNDGRRV